MKRKSVWLVPLSTAFSARRSSQLLLRLVLLAAVLWLVFSTADLDVALSRLRRLDTRYLGSMFAVNLLVIGISSYRWFLLGVVANVRAPWPVFLRTTWVSWAIAECGPTLIASEWSRYWLMRGCADPMKLALTQLADRLSGFLGLLALTVVVVIGRYPIGVSFAGSAVLAAALTLLGVGSVLVARRRLRYALGGGGGEVSLLGALMAKPVPHLLSLVINLLFATNLLLAGKAIGIGADGLGVLLLAPVVLSATVLLPSVVSDWGKREAAAVLVLQEIGIASEDSIAMSLVYGAVNMASAVPGLLGILGRTMSRAR